VKKMNRSEERISSAGAEVSKRLKEISGNAKPQLGSSSHGRAELGLGVPGIEDDEATALNALLWG